MIVAIIIFSDPVMTVYIIFDKEGWHSDHNTLLIFLASNKDKQSFRRKGKNTSVKGKH